MTHFQTTRWLAIAICFTSSMLNLSLLKADDASDPFYVLSGWRASERTPKFSIIPLGGIILKAPFDDDETLQRVVIDRPIDVEEAKAWAMADSFTLDVETDSPEAFGHVTLYFHSGDGWYGCSGAVAGDGETRITFLKNNARPEGTPGPWEEADGIRIAFWRGKSMNARIALKRLGIERHSIAIVACGPDDDRSEASTSRDTAERIGDMLDRAGLSVGLLDQDRIDATSLEGRRIVILPYNPRMTDEAVDLILDYWNDGGRVICCYSVPQRLMEGLGFGPASRFVRPDDRGLLSKIVFGEKRPIGCPVEVDQGSWNIRLLAEDADADVLAEWHDAEGNPTGYPAFYSVDRAIYFTHVILSDDAQRKQEMLTALVGSLEPEFWREMAEAEAESWAYVGSFDRSKPGPSQMVSRFNVFLKGLALSSPTETEIEMVHELAAPIQEAVEFRDIAETHMLADRYPEAIEAYRKAHALFVEGYLRTTDGPATEGRAWWNHSGTGAYPGDWDRTCRELAESGFNMILPNMLWGGVAHYESDVLPSSSTYQQYGDQIEQCLEAAKTHGLEVHVWKVDWNLSHAPREFIDRMHSEGRTQVTRSGEPADWLCPSHPENQRLELESLLEVAEKYDVDGLHFDYIRYPGPDNCFCDGCRERFEATLGQTVENWPEDCASGELLEPYRQFRCDQITRLVEAVSREARAIRPDIKISAAVFSSYPSCRNSVAQDWPLWVREGYLDFLCPMDYTESDAAFEGLVADQLERVGGRIPVYPGIGATATNCNMTADRVVSQIEIARRLGAEGFTIFNLSEGTLQEIGQGVGLGATSTPSVPPHAE
jgi:uncharacterized lipoprotein YddW (UPF0748 family)